MSSLFASRAYYAFGFLALTAGVVSLTTATVTILFTYFILCAEEYRYVIPIDWWTLSLSIQIRWHWRAFLIGCGKCCFDYLWVSCVNTRARQRLLGPSLWHFLLGVSTLSGFVLLGGTLHGIFVAYRD